MFRFSSFYQPLSLNRTVALKSTIAGYSSDALIRTTGKLTELASQQNSSNLVAAADFIDQQSSKGMLTSCIFLENGMVIDLTSSFKHGVNEQSFMSTLTSYTSLTNGRALILLPALNVMVFVKGPYQPFIKQTTPSSALVMEVLLVQCVPSQPRPPRRKPPYTVQSAVLTELGSQQNFTHPDTAFAAKVKEEVAKEGDIIDAILTKRVMRNFQKHSQTPRGRMYLSVSTSNHFVLLTAVCQCVTVPDPDIQRDHIADG